LNWSDELGASASQLVKQISGCNVYSKNLFKKQDESAFLKTLATFEEHERYVFYPESYEWLDEQEAASYFLYE